MQTTLIIFALRWEDGVYLAHARDELHATQIFALLPTLYWDEDEPITLHDLAAMHASPPALFSTWNEVRAWAKEEVNAVAVNFAL